MDDAWRGWHEEINSLISSKWVVFSWTHHIALVNQTLRVAWYHLQCSLQFVKSSFLFKQEMMLKFCDKLGRRIWKESRHGSPDHSCHTLSSNYHQTFMSRHISQIINWSLTSRHIKLSPDHACHTISQTITRLWRGFPSSFPLFNTKADEVVAAPLLQKSSWRLQVSPCLFAEKPALMEAYTHAMWQSVRAIDQHRKS